MMILIFSMIFYKRQWLNPAHRYEPIRYSLRPKFKFINKRFETKSLVAGVNAAITCRVNPIDEPAFAYFQNLP